MDRSIFDKNVKALCALTPAWSMILEKGAESGPGMLQCGWTQVEDKQVLYAVWEEKVYQLDTLYDTDRLMEMWFALYPEINSESRFVWFGLGNGMYVRKLLAGTPDSVHILVYEPSLDILCAALAERDFCDIFNSGRVHLVVPTMPEDTLSGLLYRYLDAANKKYLMYGCYLNYGTLFPEERKKFYDEIQNVLNAVNSTQNVLERYGQYYFENTLANYPYLLKGRTLQQLFYALPKNIPAVIVAAGPSLDKNVEELRNAKGRAFIIAVDSALHALVDRGILPDIFITVDGKKMPSHFADPEIRNIPVICCLQGNKDVLGLHTGKKFFFDDDNPYIRQFFRAVSKEFAGVSTGGSVANDAFSVAVTLRFRTIILVGQDLAYTGNKTHAGKTVRGQLGESVSEMDVLKVEGYYGDMVYTSPEFQLYRRWFENEIRTNPWLHVINCTEGGARIQGTEQMPLREALGRECGEEVPIDRLIGEIPPFFSDEEQQLLKDYMRAAADKLKGVKRLAEKSIRDYERMQLLIHRGKLHSKEMQNLLSSVGEAADQIEAEPAMFFVESRMYEENSKILEDVIDGFKDERQEILHAADKGIQYLKLLKRTIDETEPLLESALVKTDPAELIEKNKRTSQIELALNRIRINSLREERYWNERQ